MLDVIMADYPTDATLSSTKGFYNKPFNSLGRMNTSSSLDFPEKFTNNATEATERPAWREYWAKLYEYYTVLGCEYEIIIHNPINVQQTEMALMAMSNGSTGTLGANLVGQPAGYSTMNTDIVCALQMDTYSDTSGSTGNVMPLTRYSEIRAYKNIRWYPIEGGKKTVIRGTYKPGQAKRNIVNDGDVKTWTATSVTLPNLKEILTLNFFNDPFYAGTTTPTYNASGFAATGGHIKGCANIEVNLKYIVQYKDLKVQARYPNTLQTDQDITQILNETVNASGSALQSWTTASG